MLQYVHLMKLIKPSALYICKKYYSMYYIYTRNIFILSFLLSITNQFMGESVIFCNMAHETSISETMVYSFCYLNGTYTTYNGIRYYHHYYKWISLTLILEAFAFYIPYFIWSHICYNYIENITYSKNEDYFKLNMERCKYILKEIKNSNFHMYIKHTCLELIFFINLILQFTLLHILLNFKFFTLDYNILFPYVTKCEIYGSGVSGDNSKLKLLCNLPLNILYKKIFIVIYIWFCILIISNICYFIFDTIIMIKFKKGQTFNQWLLYCIVIRNVSGEDKKHIQSEFFYRSLSE